MDNWVTVYSECRKCKEPIKVSTLRHLEQEMQDTPQAECSVCNIKSLWRRCLAEEAVRSTV